MSERRAEPPVLDRVLDAVRGRVRLRRVLEGLAWTLACVVVVGVGAVVLMVEHRFDPGTVANARALVWLCLGALLMMLVLAPMLHRESDHWIARLIERRFPGLDALVISAVEAARPRPGVSRRLIRALVERAGRACEERGVAAAERRGLRRARTGIAALVAAVGLAMALVPPGYRHGARLLLEPWLDPLQASPFRVTVTPGDQRIAAGRDQLFVARPLGFEAREAVLVTRRSADAPWERVPMVPAAEGGGFETYLLDIDQPLQYYVEADRVRSERHRIDVVVYPEVERLDLAYEYPSYTGLAPREVQGGGDVRAVRGTRVSVRVHASTPDAAGALVFDDGRSLALGAEGEALAASFEVAAAGRYHVDLQASDGSSRAATPEYAIEPVDDAAPSVEVRRPGRDTQVTRIEELELEVGARDDLGLAEVELVLSVNGGAEQPVALGDAVAAASPQAVDAVHTIYFEDLGLEPGDLVSYHVRARDRAPGADRETLSDLYFLEVRPFDRVFRRAAAGGGGGGGGGGNESALAAQQRSLVIATFKTVRDREALADGELEGRVTILAQGQQRIRDRVDAIVRRLERRSLIERNEGYQRMAEELPRASAAMLRVEALFAVHDLEGGLVPAREALRHLQRADAAFREVQVAMGQGGAGAGNASDLANLFRLEMDKFRNQYQQVDRKRGTPEALDDTLKKLEELARRQQREIERARLRAQSAGGQGGQRSQRELAAELDELIRRLERLSREQPSPELEASLAELREAAEAMRRAAEGGEDGSGEGRDAAERLAEAQRLLDEAGGGGELRREVREALRRAERLEAGQEEVAGALERLPGAGRRREAAIEEILDRKQDMARSAEALRERLEQLAEGWREQSPDVSQQVGSAAEQLRDDDLIARIERSASSLRGTDGQPAPELEERIRGTIGAVRERLARAAGERSGTAEERLARALDRVRAAARSLQPGEGGRGEGRARGERGEQGRDGKGETQTAARGGERGQGEQGQDGQGRDGRGEQGQGGQGGETQTATRPGDGATAGGRAAGGPGTGPQGGSFDGRGGGRDGPGRWRRGTWAGAPDLERIQRGLSRSAAALDDARRELERSGHQAGDIADVLQALDQAVTRGALDAPGADALGERLAESLRAAERALLEALEGERPTLVAAGVDETPAGYEEAVREYYRRLGNR